MNRLVYFLITQEGIYANIYYDPTNLLIENHSIVCLSFFHS